MDDSSWSWAVELVGLFLRQPARLPHLMERLPSSLDKGRRRRCQFLLYGVVRHLMLLESALDEQLRKRPRRGLRASLLVASYELLADPDNSARVVDHAVGKIGKRFSGAERGMANAVLRKAAPRIAQWRTDSAATIDAAATILSHPDWLLQRWSDQFGDQRAIELARWNQKEPALYILPISDDSGQLGVQTPWPPYRKISGAEWAEVARRLEHGDSYVQDPGARLGVEALAEHFTGGRILDLCAAPGGKSVLLQQLLGPLVQEIVAIDLPGPRFDRLKANVERVGADRVRPTACDLFQLDAARGSRFDAVYLDAPCSNTGVLQKKPDVKWRLEPSSFAELIELQGRMLAHAARLVEDPGWLVYSTCSVDHEENEGVVARFLGTALGRSFNVVERRLSLPWETDHDGAGICLLRRSTAGS